MNIDVFKAPVTLAVLFGGTMLVQADTLLNTFSGPAPGYTTAPASNWAVFNSQFVDLPFAVTGTYDLSSISVVFEGDPGASIIQLYLKADNAGIAGATLESFAVLLTSASQTLYSLNSVLHPVLTTGEYHLEAAVNDHRVGGAWIWNNSGNTSEQLFSSDGGTTWTASDNTTVAAQVFGIPVPEPSTWLILGFGAAMSWLMLRRKSKPKYVSLLQLPLLRG